MFKKKNYYPNPSEYLENFKDEQHNIDILEHKILSDGINDTQFEESFSIILNEDNIIEDKIYFNPFIYKFFSENPFKLQKRTYSIDFGYKDAYFYSFELDLKNKYEVLETPNDISLRLPNNSGNFIVSTQVSDDRNKLKLLLKISFNNTKYSADYYDSLKQFMGNIVNTQVNSLIVLKKK